MIMGLFEAIIKALLMLCLVMLAYFLIFWVLGTIGISIPIMVQHIILVMIILIAILILARMFWPFIGGTSWFPPRGP
jgi:hypothetical protein